MKYAQIVGMCAGETITYTWPMTTASDIAYLPRAELRTYAQACNAPLRCEYCGSKQDNRRVTCTQCGALL